jgi:hypothetical protein
MNLIWPVPELLDGGSAHYGASPIEIKQTWEMFTSQAGSEPVFLVCELPNALGPPKSALRESKFMNVKAIQRKVKESRRTNAMKCNADRTRWITLKGSTVCWKHNALHSGLWKRLQRLELPSYELLHLQPTDSGSISSFNLTTSSWNQYHVDWPKRFQHFAILLAEDSLLARSFFLLYFPPKFRIKYLIALIFKLDCTSLGRSKLTIGRLARK